MTSAVPWPGSLAANNGNCTPGTKGCFNVPTAQQQCLNNYNNSTTGKVIQFFSLYNLATNVTNAWKDWTLYPGMKIAVANLLKWGSQFGNTEFLSVTGGTSTVVTAPTAAGVTAAESVLGLVAPAAIAGATMWDIDVHQECAYGNPYSAGISQ